MQMKVIAAAVGQGLMSCGPAVSRPRQDGPVQASGGTASPNVHTDSFEWLKPATFSDALDNQPTHRPSYRTSSNTLKLKEK